MGYSSEPKPKARMISWGINEGYGINFNFQGLSQNAYNEISLNANFQKNTYFGTGFSVSFERLFEEEFGVRRTATRGGAFFGGPERSTNQFNPYIYGGTRPNKKVTLNTFIGYGVNSFDFDFGALPKFVRVSPPGIAAIEAAAARKCPDPVTKNFDPACFPPLDPGPGKSFNVDFGVNYLPTKPWSMSMSVNHSHLRRNDTGLLAYQDNIYSFRSTYQFSRFVFARARVDYDTLSANARGQFLFGYTPNPGTALYVGYNDDLTYNGNNPFSGEFERGLRRNGRTFFIKLSYLFRKSFGG
jgi:hypothetical protein